MRDPKDYIIFPLDVAERVEAEQLVRRLAGHVGLFKIGLELFIRSGPDLIRWVRAQGDVGIFLDLKLHDIPATVSRAMAAIAHLQVDLTTVHCGENPEMLEAAVQASQGRTKVLGVTVLTSVGSQELHRAGFPPALADNVQALVLQRAAGARAAGCAGVVCSGWEAASIKQTIGADFLAVTPGIRPSWNSAGPDDQRRVMTPVEAVRNGADYLVIGRPIRDAADPVGAAQQVADEIAEGLF
ncbi:MAG: orotidine-5'-phosphate decarboxylase [Desulfobacterales bacterium]|jgi:orotidine-5'-phosphate decarboxylase